MLKQEQDKMTTYLVTGANRGIGLEYCRQLKQLGNQVIAVCRSTSEELDSLGVTVISGIEITEYQTIADLVVKLDGETIDVLINNAGIVNADSFDYLNFDSIRQQFEINAIGTLKITKALLPNLPKGGKVIIMTSRMGSIEDNTSGGYYGYRLSKAAVSMAGKCLSIDLKPEEIAVAILHPGLVKTRMTGFTDNGITTEQSVTGLLSRIDELTLENTGTFWHSNGEVLPW